MQVCPHLQYAFQILGKKWNGMLVHYLSIQPNYSAHFSQMKRDLSEITARALSMKLQELIEFGLLEKHVSSGTPIVITYCLTEKGIELSHSLAPIQQWAAKYNNEGME
ncbi:winged helix-turn-helix transcriptional regulator [Paenibacillus yanchengensis]|uniref:winged helix-turn-helix transcriptional regulator n=1 Tax=Paenibacillus yanchengensis TaxID=2035833 RepID=UPI003628A356